MINVNCFLDFMLFVYDPLYVGLIREKLSLGFASNKSTLSDWERSGSMVECLTQDRGAAGSSLTGVTVLWSLSKTYSS